MTLTQILTQILLVVAVLGMAAIVAGVAMLWGPAVALMVGGGMAIVATVALIDPVVLRGKR